MRNSASAKTRLSIDLTGDVFGAEGYC